MSYDFANTERILGLFKSADFNSTADQSIAIRSSKYVVRHIVVSNASASLTLAAGGIYTGTGKSGTIVVAAAQAYSTLTDSTKYLDLTLASAVTTDILTSQILYLSLTVPQGSAATADVYIFGDTLP